MPHDHHHHHPHAHGADLAGRRLWLAVVVNLLLTLAQIIGGLLAGSLALVADALHNFSDAASLVLALVARKIGRRPADELRTYGYGRAEVVAALINLTSILIVALYLLGESIMRSFHRTDVDGWIVVVVASVALVVDVATAMLTYSMSKDSVNIRAAFLHNVSDAMASVGVIVAGTLIILFDWWWTDIVVTVLISIYIIWMSIPPLKKSIAILMQSVPEDVSITDVAKTIESVDHVLNAHDIHVWPIDEHRRSVEAHVVVAAADLPAIEQIKQDIRAALHEQLNIDHSTLELELDGQCRSADASCHDLA